MATITELVGGRIEREITPDIVTLRLVGEFDIANVDGLKDSINSTLDGKFKHLELDLVRAHYIDGQTVQALIVAARICEGRGIKMTLLLSKRSAVERVLGVSNTLKYFDCQYP